MMGGGQIIGGHHMMGGGGGNMGGVTFGGGSGGIGGGSSGTINAGGAGGGVGGMVVSGGGGGMNFGVVGGGGAGFPGGLQYSLKFGNGRCIYPEDGQTSAGTKLVIPSEACRSDKAKFTISDTGNLQHVKTGYCVQPENEQLTDETPIVISEACDKKWAFTMTPSGSLKLAESGKCIQPLSGGTDPSPVEKLVFKNDCDKPENKFQIEGMLIFLSLVMFTVSTKPFS